MLFLRLLPIFPFWLINIVPALLNVGLGVFFITTFIGIIPGSAVYAAVGNGLSTIFAAGQTPNFGIIFEPQIYLNFSDVKYDLNKTSLVVGKLPYSLDDGVGFTIDWMNYIKK